MTPVSFTEPVAISEFAEPAADPAELTEPAQPA